MKKYFLSFAIFSFFIFSFFVLVAQQNTAFALSAGAKCFTTEGCGSTTLACVPDGKMCGTGITERSCGTGVCTAKTATGGSCTKSASICDSTKGYACLVQKCTTSGAGIGSQQTCTYSCQQQKKTSGSCDPNNSTCDSSKGYTCIADKNNAKDCGSINAPACNFSCQQKATLGHDCSGSGQGSCASGLVCLQDASKCTNVIGTTICQSTCQQKNVAPGKGCAGSGQGNCQSGYECLQDASKCTNVIGTTTCLTTCQKKGNQGDQCTGSGQGSCSSGLVCLQDASKCTNVIGTSNCQSTCQQPQSPSALPPPPLPPCKTWLNGQCIAFSTGFGSFSTDPAGFIQRVFAILLSISGGIALLLIIKAGYQLMTAQGKPEQLQNGRDQLIAAIVGLVFLIFSFVFLQVIGFDILHLPGFKGGTGPAMCNPSQCFQDSLCTAKNPGRCNTNGCPPGKACVQ